MTENDHRQKSDDSQDSIYPPADFAVIYADGVISLHWDDGIVKYYLGRSDPAIGAVGQSRVKAIAQVATSIPGFARMAIFFEVMLKRLEKDGQISAEELEKLRAAEPE